MPNRCFELQRRIKKLQEMTLVCNHSVSFMRMIVTRPKIMSARTFESILVDSASPNFIGSYRVEITNARGFQCRAAKRLIIPHEEDG